MQSMAQYFKRWVVEYECTTQNVCYNKLNSNLSIKYFLFVVKVLYHATNFYCCKFPQT